MSLDFAASFLHICHGCNTQNGSGKGADADRSGYIDAGCGWGAAVAGVGEISHYKYLLLSYIIKSKFRVA